MDKRQNKRSGGIRQHSVSWMNGDGRGLIHPVTGHRLQGESWHVVSGCTPEFQCWVRCWARKLSVERLAFNPKLRPEVADAYARFTPYFHQDRLSRPLHWRKPRAIWVAGMGDLFHEQIRGQYIATIFGVMAQASQHLFIILTKRGQRALEWAQWGLHDVTIPWPLPNVWLGTSVSNQAEADERIPLLLQAPAALHMVSVEPMLGPIDLTHMDVEKHVGDADMYQINALTGRNTDMGRPCRPCPGKLGWVLCGGETQPGARPCDPAWVRDLRDQCIRAGVAFHFKGWGTGGCGKCLGSGVISAPYELDAEDCPECDGTGKGQRGRELDGRTWEQVPGRRRADTGGRAGG